MGKEGLGEELRQEHDQEARPKRKQSLAQIVSEMAKVLKVKPEVLAVPGRARGVSRLRMMITYVLVRRGGYGVKEVTEYFGRDSTTISSLLSRYERRMQEQVALGRAIERRARFV